MQVAVGCKMLLDARYCRCKMTFDARCHKMQVALTHDLAWPLQSTVVKPSRDLAWPHSLGPFNLLSPRVSACPDPASSAKGVGALAASGRISSFPPFQAFPSFQRVCNLVGLTGNNVNSSGQQSTAIRKYQIMYSTRGLACLRAK
jgi:hypothetical protein